KKFGSDQNTEISEKLTKQTHPPNAARVAVSSGACSVMYHKYITKVVWHILAQLSSLNNTMSMVSGVSVQVSVRAALSPRSRRRTRTR
ncbi:MAG: hypothetical protein V3V39_06045, partial [Desulfobacterales bacterium]